MATSSDTPPLLERYVSNDYLLVPRLAVINLPPLILDVFTLRFISAEPYQWSRHRLLTMSVRLVSLRHLHINAPTTTGQKDFEIPALPTLIPKSRPQQSTPIRSAPFSLSLAPQLNLPHTAPLSQSRSQQKPHHERPFQERRDTRRRRRLEISRIYASSQR